MNCPCLMAPAAVLLVGASALLSAAHAQWIDEGVLDEDRVDRAPPGEGVDPNEAPLFVLSRIAGIERSGAGRIGRARGGEPIERFEDLRGIVAEIGVGAERRFRFGAAPSLEYEARHVSAWRSGARSDLREAEVQRGGITARLLVERDRGESRRDDFRSWSISRTGGDGSKVVAGDISARLGSGLLVGTVPPFTSPLSPSLAGRSALKPYRSRSESNAHFGVAAERAAAAGRLFVLITDTSRDARIDGNGRFSSIETSGYHTTEAEESRRDALKERIVALRWERSGSFGLTAAALRYDPSAGGGDLDRKPTAFRGSALQALSADLRAGAGPVEFAAEGAWSSAGGCALRGGVALRRPRWTVTLRLRSFARRFHAPRGTVYHRFGSEPVGETGAMLIGRCRARPLPGKVTGRLHWFRSHARTWLSAEPVEGVEWYLRHEGRVGALSPWIVTGGEERLETRGGRRVVLGRRSWGAGLRCRGPGGTSVRMEAKLGERSDGADARKKRNSGFSVIVRCRRVSLAWTAVGAGALPLIFPAPALRRSMPIEWYGGGRSGGGLRGGVEIPLAGGLRCHAVASADLGFLEIARSGASGGDHR